MVKPTKPIRESRRIISTAIFPMRIGTSTALWLGCLLLPLAAIGEETSSSSTIEAVDLPASTEVRGGFTLGVTAGPALGAASGNPSGKSERDDPSLERTTDLGFGYRVTPFLAGTLTDWFSVGLGVSFGNLSDGEYQSPLTTFVFRLEAFPLFGWGGIYRNFGMSAEFGAGRSTLQDKNENRQVADSGALSALGLGVFWEVFHTPPMAVAPYVGVQHNVSRWYDRNDVVGGLRIVLYGSQL